MEELCGYQCPPDTPGTDKWCRKYNDDVDSCINAYAKRNPDGDDLADRVAAGEDVSRLYAKCMHEDHPDHDEALRGSATACYLLTTDDICQVPAPSPAPPPSTSPSPPPSSASPPPPPPSASPSPPPRRRRYLLVF